MRRSEIEQSLLGIKRRKMAQSAFTYYRGTGDAFYRRWLPSLLRIEAPVVWLNGDMHLENFGTYRGDNRLTYFDIGDFDDACRGPATVDLFRFVTGLVLARTEMGITRRQAQDLCQHALRSYRAALQDGKARWLERRIASGAIGDLLHELEGRSQASLLEKRTVLKNGKRRLRFDTGKAMKLGADSAARVIRAVDRFAARRAHPDFFRVLDVAQRVAGVGALGRARYVVLVAGNGGRQGQALIDLKLQPGSIVAPLLAAQGFAQPDYANEARRVVSIEYHLPAVAPAFLTDLKIGRDSYTFRELQPDQDKLEAKHLAGDTRRRKDAVGAMAELIAWAQLRTSGWQQSSSIDDLMAWGARKDWVAPLLSLANQAARAIESSWATESARGAANPAPEKKQRR